MKKVILLCVCGAVLTSMLIPLEEEKMQNKIQNESSMQNNIKSEKTINMTELVSSYDWDVKNFSSNKIDTNTAYSLMFRENALRLEKDLVATFGDEFKKEPKTYLHLVMGFYSRKFAPEYIGREKELAEKFGIELN